MPAIISSDTRSYHNDHQPSTTKKGYFFRLWGAASNELLTRTRECLFALITVHSVFIGPNRPQPLFGIPFHPFTQRIFPNFRNRKTARVREFNDDNHTEFMATDFISLHILFCL